MLTISKWSNDLLKIHCPGKNFIVRNNKKQHCTIQTEHRKSISWRNISTFYRLFSTAPITKPETSAPK